MRLKKQGYSGYLFVEPAICFILASAIIPIGMTYNMTRFDIINPPAFTGLTNYKRLPADLLVSELRSKIRCSVPSRDMRKFICRLWLNEVNQQ